MRMLEIIGALLIMLIITYSLSDLIQQGFVVTQQRQAADQLALVTRAAAGYVRKHHGELSPQATASSGPTVTIATMVTEGFLATGFRDRNVWGQAYQVYIRKDANSGDLRAVVLTSGGRGHDTGSNFGTSVVPGAAALMGGVAGFVATGDVPGQSSGTLQGSGGGWSLSLATLGIPSPGGGHLGSLSNFDSYSLSQDYLYRVEVPGHPELNQMQTELDMTKHDINNVSAMQFVEREISSETCVNTEDQGRIFLDKKRGLYLCRNNSLEIIGDSGNSTLVKNVTVAFNGDEIDKPQCAPETNTVPTIFTSPAIAAAGPVSPPMSSIQTWATNVSDAKWQVHLRVLTDDRSISYDDSGWVYPPADFHRITVLTTCAKVVTP